MQLVIFLLLGTLIIQIDIVPMMPQIDIDENICLIHLLTWTEFTET